MMDPIVIDPPGFDQHAAWKECSEYVEKCGGMQHEDGDLYEKFHKIDWRKVTRTEVAQ